MSTTSVRHEHRWPPIAALVVALLLYALLPSRVSVLPNWVLPALCLLMLAPLVAVNPFRLTRETSWSRWLSVTVAIVLTVANQVTLALIVVELIQGKAQGIQVLVATLQVWVTSAIAFGLVYWEIDRGGPVARRTAGFQDAAPPDFRFPQQGGCDAEWEPQFVDYAYFSLTNMMAFSPTDFMPLSVRAKGLMAYQAVTAFILLALVISRAVNILT